MINEMVRPPALDAAEMMRMLDRACAQLEAAEEHAAAAFVGQGMAIIAARYGLEAAGDAE